MSSDQYSSRAISALDGRYRRQVEELSEYCSEYALSRYRVRVEVEWFALICNEGIFEQVTEANVDVDKLTPIWSTFSSEDSVRVRDIERQINHDVKAVEYFVKDAISALGLGSLKELVHFGCTSEDITNLAYALMLTDIREKVLIPGMKSWLRDLVSFAESHVRQPMLSRTHGQTASPTTVGKELANSAVRLASWLSRFEQVQIQGKMNGAVGNFNAHVVAAPRIDWQELSRSLVERLDLVYNPYTTQIEPHDWIAEYLNAVVGFNQVLLDFVRDTWGYISLGYFKQRTIEGETGSSTMPHKVNPIDFENAEGNIGIANTLAKHLSEKLLVSRWQRDLSDSTAMRNLGSIFGHTDVAIKSARRGLGKLAVNVDCIEADLDDSWEVLTEAVQTVMRSEGSTDPYEAVKAIARGGTIDRERYRKLLHELELSQASREQLKSLTPASYLGLAPQLARQALNHVKTTIADDA